MPAERKTDDADTLEPRELLRGEHRFEIDGESGVVVVLRLELGAAVIQAKAGEAGGYRRGGEAAHVRALGAATEPVQRNEEIAGGGRRVQRAGEGDRADGGILDLEAERLAGRDLGGRK